MEKSRRRTGRFLVAFVCIVVAVVFACHKNGVRGDNKQESAESDSRYSMRQKALLEQGRALVPSGGVLLRVTSSGRNGASEWKLDVATPFTETKGIAIAASDDALLMVKGRVVRNGPTTVDFDGEFVVLHGGTRHGATVTLSLKNDVPVTVMDNEAVAWVPGPDGAIVRRVETQKITISAIWHEEGS